MYNENNNVENNGSEYHYSYQSGYQSGYPEPWNAAPNNSEPPKKKSRKGLRIAATALCAVLVVGAAFGAGWFVNSHVSTSQKSETQIRISDRERPVVETVSVTGNKTLTYPEIYSANVNACVSINVSSQAGYNIFGQPVETASSGSGFLVTSDGYIVTNYHVIEDATTVEVTLYNGKTYTAQIVGGDKDYDIAVIRIEADEDDADGFQSVVLGTSSSLQVGDEILAIGNPLGELTFSMSEGIVSCLDREINLDGTPFNMIQITAAVNHGNSGGPLFNTYGEVVGIVAAKSESSSSYSSSGTVEGLGFAIPIDDVAEMIQDIMENGQVTSHAYMGVTVSDAARYPETGVKAGAYIVEVVEDGPASKAGLQAGDVITMVGSTLISSQSDVTSVVGSKSYRAGDTATITYVRDGKVCTTELTFGSRTEMPEETTDSSTQQESSSGQQNSDSSDSGSYPYGSGDMEDFFEYFFGQRAG